MAAALSIASPHRAARPATGLLSLLVVASGCLLGSPAPTATTSASSSIATTTPRASSSARASASTVASPGTLGPGTYAKVLVDGLRIRLKAKADATAVGALFVNDVVRIRADAGVSGGIHWYDIETIQTGSDQHLTGFIAGAKGGTAYLEAMSGPPPPKPSATPRSSAAPTASAPG